MQDAAEKKLKRAHRFGTDVSAAKTDGKLSERAKRFGTQVPVINGERIKYIDK